MYSQLFTSRRPVMTLNAKGANAFVSTTNPVLDLFTYTSRKFYENEEDFNKLCVKGAINVIFLYRFLL